MEFDQTLTVVYGASDTGKSLIAESIEYMLGGSKLALPTEAEGYSQILLGLLLPNGTPLTLLRTPGGNNIYIHHEDLRSLVVRTPDTQVTATHTVRSKNSLSIFLLDQMGLGRLKIRKNEAGNARTLSLSDLVHLSVIPETRMVDPLSPVRRSRSASGKTAAASVMRLLLTGDDDPDIVGGPNAGQRRVNKGQISLLDQIVVDLHQKLTSSENPRELRNRQIRLQTSIDEHSNALQVITGRHLDAITARMQAAEELARLESRLAEISDLVTRFLLLEAQYESDLARLEMVTEAGSILGFFQAGTCVFCGAEVEHQNPGHGEHEATQLHVAVRNETAKTNTLLADLRPTIQDLRIEFDELGAQRMSLLEENSRRAEEINAVEQEISPLRQRMEESLRVRSSIERDLELHERIEELEERRSQLDAAGAVSSRRPAGHIPSRVMSVFDETLRRTLEAWQVPSVEFAEYDQYEMDVRAGGRLRSERGKGVRSVLHSAFTTALAKYCSENSRPRLGFIVLDSPVVTYRDPIGGPIGDDVDMTTNVVDHFYRDMLDYPGQVVIIENGDPPVDVDSQARTYCFVGSAGGRSGFFPKPD
ncbi:hypothetical protein [Actinomadura sp. 9N215]|uniref:hypothetical protein n=1 Tax=Actinomadura sp. 9N215 TaxID=3375150 RepID=UPI00379A680A